MLDRRDQPEQAALAESLLQLARMAPAEIQSQGAGPTAAVRASVEALYLVEQGTPGALARYVARSFHWAIDAAQDRTLNLLLFHLESTRPSRAEQWGKSKHLYWPARRLGAERFRLAAQVVYLLRAGHPNEPPAAEGLEALPHQPGLEELCAAMASEQEQREIAFAHLAAVSSRLTPRQEEAARLLLGPEGCDIRELAGAMNCDESVARKHVRGCLSRLAAGNCS